MLALVDGKPEVLNLKQILDEYLKHQEEVVTRRIKFDLEKAEKRAHILEGFMIAISNIDEVIKIYGQAMMMLRKDLWRNSVFRSFRLSLYLKCSLDDFRDLNSEKIEEEHKALMEKIAYFKTILADENKLLGVIKDEILATKSKYADPTKNKDCK